MINNLAEYFEQKHEFYLDNVVYNRLENELQKEEYVLNCTDNIEVSIIENGVKLTIKRIIKFEPEDIFALSVSFGAILKFNDDKKEEYDWNSINLAEEFKENGGFVTNNLMSRISLLVAQITSSFGQAPIMLQPNIVGKR